MSLKALATIVSVLLFSGCTHVGNVSMVNASNVYSGYDAKILGKVTYAIDTNSLSKLRKDDAVSGYVCGAHRFPIEGGSAFAASVPSMLEAVFEDQPQHAEMAGKQAIHLLFRVERFEPRLKFNKKFFSMDADATVELGVSAVGTIDGKRVFGTSVDSQRNRTGDAKGMCEGGGDVLADATRDVIKDVLEKLGERMANSQQMRSTKSQ